MDSTAIQIIQQTAIEADQSNRLGTFVPALILRDESGQQRVKSIEHLQENRSFFRGTYNTPSMQDFMAYIVARNNGQCFIDSDKMAAAVFFDLMVGESGALQPGHGKHVANLVLPRTAAFAALVEASKHVHSQKELSEFLEDWPENLAADYADTAPPVADPKFLNRAIAAVRNVKIKSTGASTHVEGDFNRSRSSLEDVEASSEHTLPAGFRFTGIPYEGLDSITAYVRLGVSTDQDKPRFKLHIRGYGALIEKIGQNFKAKLLAGIGDKATMLLGTFELGE